MRCKVRERSFNSEANAWAISLESCGESHDLILHNPFSTTEAEDVDWFFQQYSRFPLADATRARKVVKAIENYGKELFRQTIGALSSGDSLAWRRFAELREKGALDELRVEIFGSAAFQQLYWEALRDDEPGSDDRPLTLRAEVIRRPLAAAELNRLTSDTPKVSSEALHDTASWTLPSRPLNILLVVARPAGLEDVGLRFISGPILDALYSPAPDRTLQARLDVVRPGSFEELQSKLEKASARGLQYDIVHFDMHGRVSRDRNQVLMSFQAQDTEGSNDVSASAVASVLKKHRIPMVVLNACSSAFEAGQEGSSIGSVLVKTGISYVIAMRYDIQIASAATAVRTLYQTLQQKKSTTGLIAAIRETMFQEHSKGLFHGFDYPHLDWLLPVAYVGESLSPISLSSVQPGLLDHELSSRSALAKSFETTSPYGLVGRERDILNIETILFHGSSRKPLLIHGLRGVGKSSLLQHLCWWWAATGLVTTVLRLDFALLDGSSDSSDQLVEMIARQISLPASSPNRSLAEQLIKDSLSKVQSSETSLVILENVDAIREIVEGRQDDTGHRTVQEVYSNLCQGAGVVLVTQRNHIVPATFSEYRLAGINEVESLDLVSTRLGQANMEKLKGLEMRKLAQQSGGLPGALEELIPHLQSPEPGLSHVLEVFDPWHRPSEHEKLQIMKAADDPLRKEGWYEALPATQRQALRHLALLKRKIRKTVLTDLGSLGLQNGSQDSEVSLSGLDDLLETLSTAGLETEYEQYGISVDSPHQIVELHPLLSMYLRLVLQLDEGESSTIELSFVEIFYQEAEAYSKLLARVNEQQRQRALQLVALDADNLLTAMMLALRHRQVPKALSIHGVLMSHHRNAKSHQEGAAVCAMFLGELPRLNIKGPNLLEMSLLDSQGRFLRSAEALDEAQDCFARSAEILAQVDDDGKYDMLRLLEYHSLGGLALNKGAIKEAMKQFNSGCQLFKSKLDPSPGWKAMQVQFLTGLACCSIVGVNNSATPPASIYLKEARDLAQSCNDRESLAVIDMVAYLNDDSADEKVREQSFRQAKAYFLRSGDFNSVVSTLTFPAVGRSRQAATTTTTTTTTTNPHSGLQLAQDGHEQLIRAFRSAIQANNAETATSALVILGSHELDADHHDQARDYLEMALRLCEPPSQRNSVTRVHVYRMLGCIALERDQWDDAKDLFKKALAALAENPEAVALTQEDVLNRFIGFAERRYNPMAASRGVLPSAERRGSGDGTHGQSEISNV